MYKTVTTIRPKEGTMKLKHQVTRFDSQDVLLSMNFVSPRMTDYSVS